MGLIWNYTLLDEATYFVTLSSLSCRWKAIIYHNPLAPAQSNRELEFAQEYPRTGGLSGNVARNRESFSLNERNVLTDLTSTGTIFQRRAPSTAKEPSYRDWFRCEHPLTRGGVIAMISRLEVSRNFMPISLGETPFRIFHTWRKMKRSRLRCSDIRDISLKV